MNKSANLSMRAAGDSKGRLVIISGPSGVGKSSICRQIVKRMDNVYLSVSVTTRPTGRGEVNGREYRFIGEDEFHRMAEQGLLLEYAEVFGHHYGTPKKEVLQALDAGNTVLLEIDSQGARQVKSKYLDAQMVFILPPAQKDLAERMRMRARGQAEEPKERLSGADSEIAAGWQYYEHLVINDNLEQAAREIVEIIEKDQVQSS